MSKTRKVLLSVLGILLIFSIALEIHYQYYIQSTPHETSLVEAKQDLSINYLNGKHIYVETREKEISFSVTNHSSESLTYFIEMNNLNGDYEGSTYEIIKDNETIKQTTSMGYYDISNNVEIEANATHRYTMKINNSRGVSFNFTLNIDIAEFDNSFANIVLNQNEVLESNNSYETTLSMEGLIHKEEESGSVYYFRGNVNNNYVNFANHSWKVVKINEDKSVKLIYNGVLDVLESFNVEEMVGNTNFETTHMNEVLSEWYNIQLLDYDRYISSTIYCYDDSILNDNEGIIDYLPSHRLFTDNLPTYSCSGSNISGKIALLTADEAVYAGVPNASDNTTYLDVDSLQASWWTMTPSKKNYDEVFYMAMDRNGILQREVSEKTGLFIRPVITISPKVNASGLGTPESPYELTIE